MISGDSRGFTLAEALVSLVILMIAMGSIGALLIQNTRIDKQQRMTADTVREFIERSVAPHREEFEFGKKVELGKTMLQEAGQVGLLSVDVPEAYAELADCTECLACMAGCPSFDLDDGSFGGPLAFVKLAQLHFDPRDGEDRRAQAKALGLATCPSCESRCTCPVGVPIYRAAIEPLL